MSNSMSIFPNYNFNQNINQSEGAPINDTLNNYQSTSQIQIEQNPNFQRYNSSGFLAVNGNMFKANPSSIILNSTIINPNITSSKIPNNSPRVPKTEKRMFRQNSPSHLQIPIFQQNSNENISNLQKVENIQINSINLNKIDILDDEKNDLSLLEVKPIEQLSPGEDNSFFRRSNYNLIKMSNPISDRYISEHGNNINYMNYMKNASNINNNGYISNSEFIPNVNHKLNGTINNPLDNKLIHSMSDYYSFNSLKNNVLMKNINNSFNINSINSNFNNNVINHIKKFNHNEINYNDNYYILNNNNDNNYYISNNENNINKNYNINDYYNTNSNNNTNSNIMSIQYNQINDILKEVTPEQNFNLSEFVTIKELGKGTEGVIFLVKWLKNGKEYALKKGRIKKIENVKKKHEEIKMLKEFRNKTGNDGIIRIYGDKYISKEGFYEFYEIMEFAQKDWDQEIYSRGHYKMFYTENELMQIMSQIVNTFALLQQNHITHRDIKPQNIMLVNGNFKITDFGNSRILKREGYCVQRIRGSEMYMSPAMFKGLHAKMPQVNHNSYKSDVFSLGMCFLLAAACSYHPLNLIREIYDMNAIYNIINYYLGNRYSENVLKILFSMLQVEENLRPDFIQLVSLFNQ